MLQCLILGTGVFLVELAKFDFSDVTGIDYSPSAIQLSGSIIEKEGLSHIKLKVTIIYIAAIVIFIYNKL